MNNKIIMFLLFFIFSSASVFACSNLDSSSELLNCKKKAEEESRYQMQKTYLILYNYLSDFADYQKKIKLSQEAWAESAVKNCDVYSYFAEDTSIAHDIANSECMTKEYERREEFIITIKKVADQFF